MKQENIDEIEVWSKKGQVTGSSIVLKLCAEIRELRLQLEQALEELKYSDNS